VEGEKRHQYHPLLVFDLLKTSGFLDAVWMDQVLKGIEDAN